jgi:peptidoglycan biosynthesis protein MviN/MurJ (putative lipid II flippase)
MIRQLVPLFYVLADTKTPVIISGIDLVAFIAIANFGTPRWGHVGVSAAVTGSAFVQWLLLVVMLPKKLPNFQFANLVPTAWHSLAASVFAAVFAYLLLQYSHLAGIAGGAVSAVAFGAIYLLACHAIGHPEQASLTAKLYRRLRR